MAKRTIVVGYDGGAAAERALDRAVEETRGSDARLIVLAVLEMPLTPGAPQYFGTLDDSPQPLVPPVLPPELEPVLERARERLGPAGVDAELSWAVGDPAHELVAAAREHGAGLIVVGRHHHNFFDRLFGSDVASAVRRDAGCDVIAVD